MAQLKTLDDIVKPSERDRPRQAYEKTTLSKSGTAGNRTCRALIRAADDDGKRTGSVIHQLSKILPAVSELETLLDGEIATTELVLSTGLARNGQAKPEAEKKTLILARIAEATNMLKVTEIFQKLARTVKENVPPEEEHVLIKLPCNADVTAYRKIAEGCWKANGVTAEAEFSVKPPKAEAKQKKAINQHRRQYQTSVEIGTNGSNYADAVKKLKEKSILEHWELT